jgi:hypothetical protein
MADKKFTVSLSPSQVPILGSTLKPAAFIAALSPVTAARLSPAAEPTPTPVRHARTLVGQPIGIVPDFITSEERAMLLAHVMSPAAAWETGLPKADVWHGRLINPQAMPTSIAAIMGTIRRRVAAHIIGHYGITDPVYADTMQLVRWLPGHDQRPHADCEEPDGRPNAFPWRAFASIIYLNDAFEGGQIYFPKLALEPAIRPGTLAYFPSTRDYLHGVREVTSGVRYTICSFYTFDPRRHDGHPI